MFTNLSVNDRLRRAKLFINKNKIEKAKELYQDILINFPKNLRAQQGLALLKKHKYFNKADNLLSDNSLQEYINQLINHYKQKEYSIVVEKSQAILDKYPDKLYIWNILGACFHELGKLDEAIEIYNKCINLLDSIKGVKKIILVCKKNDSFKSFSRVVNNFDNRIKIINSNIIFQALNILFKLKSIITNNINDEDIIIKEFEHYDQAHNYIDNNFKKIKEGWNYNYYIKQKASEQKG